ncbi:hypothetical protein PPL_08777 [Heterostelium album PN500]|uniref:Uncharacterized protein n=1 Tax=Heterostelium pallidum (strain ATCC 26659 / Pp 5 / PN500) TaxID=670386 RepID=D3BJP8_HETP5|nr:hypothetical protein PPL_08777 [Heterostelium album PN500]EFA78128.1 hypothetical protein PPL_08777 [Heterostelium album PN500]|eukprot:XP_020430254.1 hypothetical protein PPL_08777 [Heterostelium album PN500]
MQHLKHSISRIRLFNKNSELNLRDEMRKKEESDKKVCDILGIGKEELKSIRNTENISTTSLSTSSSSITIPTKIKINTISADKTNCIVGNA